MLYDKPSMNVCCRETFIFLGLKIKTPGIMSNFTTFNVRTFCPNK